MNKSVQTLAAASILLSLASGSKLVAQSQAQTLSPILVYAEVENARLESHLVALVTLVNGIRTKGKFAVDPPEFGTAELVYISRSDLIREGIIDPQALSFAGQEVAELMRDRQGRYEDCTLQEITFPNKRVTFVFHSLNAEVFDVKCLHFSLDRHFDLKINQLLSLKDADATALLVQALSSVERD